MSYISASQVKKHRECPLEWWFEYRSDAEPDPGTQKYLNFGLAVHEAIEENIEDHNLAFGPAVARFTEKAGEFGLPEEMNETGRDCLRRAADFIASREPTIRDVEKRVEFEIDRDNLKVDTTAIMDITTEDEIWDWKTGRVRDSAAKDEKIQGGLYMAAFYSAYGVPPEAIRFIYLKAEKLRTVEPSDETWQEMLRYARALLQDKRTGSFDARPGSHCYWCGYEFHCPDTPVGIGDVEWEKWRAL